MQYNLQIKYNIHNIYERNIIKQKQTMSIIILLLIINYTIILCFLAL